MRKILAYTLLAALMAASCSPRIVTVAVHDTTTVTRTVTVRDTVISAPLPVESVVISTPDTTSTVETSLATSTATLSAGHLRHTIENKRTALSVPAKFPEKQEIVQVTKEILVQSKSPGPTSRNGHGTSSSGQSSSPSFSPPPSGCGSDDVRQITIFIVRLN